MHHTLTAYIYIDELLSCSNNLPRCTIHKWHIFILMNYCLAVTTYLDAPYTNWVSGRGSGQPFKLSANITYLEDTYLYPLQLLALITFAYTSHQYVYCLTSH